MRNYHLYYYQRGRFNSSIIQAKDIYRAELKAKEFLQRKGISDGFLKTPSNKNGIDVQV